MKIFAMINGQQVGPMLLDDMVKEGVRPDTYIWCKGMPDWQKASEVPDVCRYFRLRLAGVLPSLPRIIVPDTNVRQIRGTIPKQPENPDSKWMPLIAYAICTVLILIGFLLMKL